MFIKYLERVGLTHYHVRTGDSGHPEARPSSGMSAQRRRRLSSESTAARLHEVGCGMHLPAPSRARSRYLEKSGTPVHAYEGKFWGNARVLRS